MSKHPPPGPDPEPHGRGAEDEQRDLDAGHDGPEAEYFHVLPLYRQGARAEIFLNPGEYRSHKPNFPVTRLSKRPQASRCPRLSSVCRRCASVLVLL